MLFCAFAEFIDVVLSKTQRKTPTVCHKGWYIQRLRSFYARKIKFTGESFSEKLTLILTDFPRLDDIHPYYADLINVLYSKHHYKLALGQISTARTLIDNIAKDYLRLIKFAETQYRCKELKRAALGRMATVAKKLNTSLGYLERVRQHLSRLPSIDPNTRTIMITGFPNVGKSSFINKVSRAEVDVQPYAFTTKSIFVGHFDYKDLRWQVVDTPGILDHSLEDRNIIEMQAITALAHLNSTVLFFVDVSETCGYTIKKQASLYHSIKALFSNKPLLVVANKIDLKKMEDLDPQDLALIEAIARDRNTEVIPMSNATEEGIHTVKSNACEMLLRQRCERKLAAGKAEQIANRITVSMPTARDGKVRTAAIPAVIAERREQERETRDFISKALREENLHEEAIKVAVNKAILDSRPQKRLLRDIEDENGGVGVFNYDRRLEWDLENQDWQKDIIPEIMDGKNIADFFDADIESRLEELEREEEELQAAFEESGLTVDNEEDELTEEQFMLLMKIRNKKAMIKDESRMRQGRGKTSQALPRTVITHTMKDAEKKLSQLGLDTSSMRETLMENPRGRKRLRTEAYAEGELEERALSKMDERIRTSSVARSVSRMRAHPSHVRSQSRMRGEAPDTADGIKDYETKMAIEKTEKRAWKKQIEYAKASESDRRILNEKPKHLFSGKRGIGSTDRR